MTGSTRAPISAARPRAARWLGALATATLAVAAVAVTPLPAHAAFGVIVDEGLAYCVNVSLSRDRPVTQEITHADLQALPLQFRCTEGPGVKSFAGFEGATRTLSVTLGVAPHSLTAPYSLAPLALMPKLGRLMLTDVPVSNAAFAALPASASLHTIEIAGAPELSDLSPLAGNVSLTTLAFTRLPALTNLTGLGDLSKLKSLDLGHNAALTNLSPLASAVSLETLTVQSTTVSDIGPLAGLTNLSTLTAPNARITSLTPLAELTQLRSVSVSNNMLSSLDGIENSAGLQHLRASDNALTDGIAALANKPQLTHVELRNTQTTSLAVLAASTQIAHLDANDNRISSLVGLREPGEATTLTVRTQNLDAPTQYVPRNASSFRVDATGQVTLRDGTTFPDLTDRAGGHTGPSPDPELPLLRFAPTPNASALRYSFTSGTDANVFSGNVTMPIVWSEITSTDTLTGRVGDRLEHPVTVTDGFPTAEFSLGNDAPSWLSIDASTGVLSGTPSVAGPTTVELRATDALGNTITQLLTITVADAAPSAISIGADQQGTAGAPLRFTLTRENAVEHPWSGEASVEVSTVDGTAQAGTDYAAFAARITWAAGDTAPKTVTVQTAPVATAATTTKTFSVRLSEPAAHTMIADRAAATGTISAAGSGTGPAAGGAIAATGETASVLPWLGAGAALLAAGAGALAARRRLR
ncbi:putative Ig domain-containing protein [Leucobacter albus]|uniref:Ig domain-containing protein n=1 Tax=Leucobacter albus TaxID=272210 RepID=A0ABW3TS26_9MICO